MTKQIILIGAGLSTQSLVPYLESKLNEYDWHLKVLDRDFTTAAERLGKPNERCVAGALDISDTDALNNALNGAHLVISMVPAHMHLNVAKACLKHKSHLVTASYLTPEMRELDQAAQDNGLVFLNECGLDPGIDHMSAARLLDGIRNDGSEIVLFESFTGGLLSPESEGTNPWRYKFTWNPRNVVLAGQGTAQYIKQGKYKYIPYAKLFERTEVMEVLDAGEFEGYANRDSLGYRAAYGLEDIPTLFRGTLRRKGYCKAWNMFVQLGMTDDAYKVENSENLTYREFINLFFPYNNELSVEEKFCSYLNLSQDSEEFRKIEWLGVFTDTIVAFKNASPAQILQKICEGKLTLDSEDKDMIVMQHQFEYVENGVQKKLNSSLLVFGDDPIYTSMAKTVGLPVAIAAKLILTGKIKSTGVKIPTTKDIYIPVLKELEENGINFVEELV